jgi:type IV pilus assembly protein PilM
MAKAIGLDVGSRSAKIVEIDGSPKKYTVTHFAECELSEDARMEGPAAIAEELSEFLKTRKISRDGVTTALPANAVTIREITVPFKNEEQIRKVVKFEAEAHLHATAIEDVVIDFLPISETEEGTRLVIFAAPKLEIGDRLALLKMADVDPRAIDLDVIALFNAVVAAELAKDDQNIVVADIGAQSTKLLLIKDGKLRSVRSLRTGTNSITRCLEADLDVPFEDAEGRQALTSSESDDLMVPAAEVEEPRDLPETRKSADRLEQDMVVDRQHEFLEKISRELGRSLAALSASSKLDAFYVTGGGSRSPEIISELSRRFDVTAEPLDLLGGIPNNIADEDRDQANASGAVALGLALKQLGAETVDVDFRQEEFAFARKFEIVKLALAVGVTFVFIMVFLYFLFLQRDVKHKELQHGRLYEGWAQGLFTKCYKNYEGILGEEAAVKHQPRSAGEFKHIRSFRQSLDGIQNELVNELGVNPDIPEIRSCIRVARDFFTHIQKVRDTKIGYLLIRQLNVTQKAISVKGEIGKIEEIGILTREIETHRRYGRVKSRAQTRTKEGHITLDITIPLCDPKDDPMMEDRP